MSTLANTEDIFYGRDSKGNKIQGNQAQLDTKDYFAPGSVYSSHLFGGDNNYDGSESNPYKVDTKYDYGTGTTYDGSTMQAMSDPKFTAWAGENDLDFNTMNDKGISKAYSTFGDGGNLSDNWVNGMKNSEVIGGGLALGSLGLGVMSYLDRKDANQAREKAMNFDMYNAVRDNQKKDADLAHLKDIFGVNSQTA